MFVNCPQSYKFGIDDQYINDNLDYLIERIEDNGSISPSWTWSNYEEEWEKAKKEWTGVLTLNALIALDNFKRLEK
jgi:hypothetical protein